MLISFSSYYDLDLIESYLFMIKASINFMLFNCNSFNFIEKLVGMNFIYEPLSLAHFIRQHME